MGIGMGRAIIDGVPFACVADGGLVIDSYNKSVSGWVLLLYLELMARWVRGSPGWQ